MKFLAIFKSYIPISAPKDDIAAREKEIIKKIVRNNSAGNTSLAFGRYKTRKDLDDGIKEFEDYSFQN